MNLIIDLIDLALLVYLCLLDRKLVHLEKQGLEIERANLELYRSYFRLRASWYSSRINKKTPETSGGLASSEISAPAGGASLREAPTQSADSGGSSGA